MKLYCVLYFFMLALGPATAQEVWTLQQCLDAGKKNSLEFQLRQLDVLSAEAIYRSLAMDFLPKADFSVSHNYSIGSTIDPATNNRISSNIQTDNFALNASLPLLDLNIFTQARRNKLAVIRAQADREAAAAEYSLNIMENYFNALYSQELLSVQQTQFENAVFNLKRVEAEVSLGSRPKSDLYDMQVSYALEENNLIETRQNLYNQKLKLLQLINVQEVSPDAMALANAQPESNPGATGEVIDLKDAVSQYPGVRAADAATAVAKKEVWLQRNRYLPVLGAYYSYSSFYYLPVNGLGGQTVAPFWTQFNDNKNHYIGAQLTIPLFNGLRTHRDVQVAKVELKKKQVLAQQERLRVQQLIETESAKQQQGAEMVAKLETARQQAEKSFTTAQAKFTNGLINAIVFTTSKNQLLTIEYNLLKAKYTMTYLNIKLKFLRFNEI